MYWLLLLPSLIADGMSEKTMKFIQFIYFFLLNDRNQNSITIARMSAQSSMKIEKERNCITNHIYNNFSILLFLVINRVFIFAHMLCLSQSAYDFNMFSLVITI